MKKYFLSILIFLVTLTACGEKNNEENTLVVGLSADNPPYEFISSGKIVGLDVDVIEAIADVMGKKLVIKNIDFPALFPAINSSSLDCVISAVSKTPEREEYFDFSNIYASSGFAVIVRADDNFSKFSDLQGKVIGAQLGTTWEIEAKKLADGMPGTLIRSLSNNLVLIEELKSGSVDAVVLEKMQVEQFIKNNKGLSFFDLPELKSEFAIVLPKGSDLLIPINNAIEKLQKENKMSIIIQKWIKSE